MPTALSPEGKHLIDRPNFAHLATLMADRSPQTDPVWVGRENEHLVVCAGEGSLKAKNTRRDPRVAMSIVDFANPYEEVQIRGRVVERRVDSDLQMMDAVSHKYTGTPFPFRNPEGRVCTGHRGRESTPHQAAVRTHTAPKIKGAVERRASSPRCTLKICRLPACYRR